MYTDAPMHSFIAHIYYTFVLNDNFLPHPNSKISAVKLGLKTTPFISKNTPNKATTSAVKSTTIHTHAIENDKITTPISINRNIKEALPSFIHYGLKGDHFTW